MERNSLSSTYASTESLAISRLRDSLMMNSSYLESLLLAFVSWSLRQSLLPQFTPTARMEILDRAWQAQKKAWELRNTQVTFSNKQQAQLIGSRLN
jgi:hypothetical protein